MWKIHKPHIENEYIKSVEFQETTDDEGVIDWLMKYTPGRRARHEYRAFTKKQEKLIEQREAARPRLVTPAPKPKDKTPPAQPEQKPEDRAAIEKLMSLGIDESRAAQIVAVDRAECELWAEAWQHQNQKGMENPAAVLISFIEKKRRPLPKGYSEAKEREARQREQEQEAQRRFAEDCYVDFFAPQFREFQREEFAQLQAENAEAFATFAKWLEKNHGRGLRMVSEEETREKITLQRAWEFFYSIRPELGVRMTSFEEWDEQRNTSQADPLEWFAQNPQAVESLYR
jgi:post-segregation antitoxin (ccd killing protein)